MRRFIFAIAMILGIFCFLPRQSIGAELGLKLGASTITFPGPYGVGLDVDFDYVVAIYLDFVEMGYTKSGVGPSFEIAYAKESLGYSSCFSGLTCDEDFTYTGFEANLKAVYGSEIRVFAYGGVSLNRIAFDYRIVETGKTGSWIEEYYWGFQGSIGGQYIFANNFSIGAEYKYKFYPHEDIDHQSFFTLNFGVIF